MLEVTCNDRLGKKIRVKCNEDDTIGDLKKLIAAQTGTRPDKIVLKKWYTIFKDHISLKDCKSNSRALILFGYVITIMQSKSNSIKLFLLDEIHDGMNLELYYQ